jgi:hypothetical protein
VFGDNLSRALFIHAAVPDALGIDDHDWAAPALIQTFNLRQHHLPAQTAFLDGALQRFGRAFPALPATGFVLADEYVRADFPEFRHLIRRGHRGPPTFPDEHFRGFDYTTKITRATTLPKDYGPAAYLC